MTTTTRRTARERSKALFDVTRILSRNLAAGTIDEDDVHAVLGPVIGAYVGATISEMIADSLGMTAQRRQKRR
jgi:hypothetical protein